jgi:hypothetical protein
MSRAGAVPTTAPGGGAPAPVGDPCPLCGAPVDAEQDWCLRCGAAARTRLAPTPNWRVPIAGIVAVIVLSLGVLAAALVALAGSSSPTKVRVTRIVTTAPAALVPAPASPVPTPTTAPSARLPSARAPGATTPRPTPVTPQGTPTSTPGQTSTSPPLTSNGTIRHCVREGPRLRCIRVFHRSK